MSSNIWYEVYVQTRQGDEMLMAKVRWQALATILASQLEESYSTVTIKQK
jgi:hypothetical protein